MMAVPWSRRVHYFALKLGRIVQSRREKYLPSIFTVPFHRDSLPWQSRQTCVYRATPPSKPEHTFPSCCPHTWPYLPVPTMPSLLLVEIKWLGEYIQYSVYMTCKTYISFLRHVIYILCQATEVYTCDGRPSIIVYVGIWTHDIQGYRYELGVLKVSAYNWQITKNHKGTSTSYKLRNTKYKAKQKLLLAVVWVNYECCCQVSGSTSDHLMYRYYYNNERSRKSGKRHEK